MTQLCPHWEACRKKRVRLGKGMCVDPALMEPGTACGNNCGKFPCVAVKAGRPEELSARALFAMSQGDDVPTMEGMAITNEGAPETPN